MNLHMEYSRASVLLCSVMNRKPGSHPSGVRALGRGLGLERGACRTARAPGCCVSLPLPRGTLEDAVRIAEYSSFMQSLEQCRWRKVVGCYWFANSGLFPGVTWLLFCGQARPPGSVERVRGPSGTSVLGEGGRRGEHGFGVPGPADSGCPPSFQFAIKEHTWEPPNLRVDAPARSCLQPQP